MKENLEKPVIAITGSPNNTREISFDVLDGKLERVTLGAIVGIGATDGRTIIGQITDVEVRNHWHENDEFKNAIKMFGRIPHLTADCDVMTGKMQVLGVYARKEEGQYASDRLKIPPGSGLDMWILTRDEIIDMTKDADGTSYVGNLYGSTNTPAPVRLRHFGHVNEGGSGEAYMAGVFGPSGSGKTVMAMTLVSLWTGKSKRMGFLILDPQSEFAENRIGGNTGFNFNLHELLSTYSNRFNPKRDVIRIDEIQLEGRRLFVDMLGGSKKEHSFFGYLGMKAKAQEGKAVLHRLLDRYHVEIADFETVMAISCGAKGTFEDVMIDALVNTYADSGKKGKDEGLRARLEEDRDSIRESWDQIARYFGPNRIKIKDIIRDVTENGRILIMDLNPERMQFDHTYKIFLMNFVIGQIKGYASWKFKNDDLANCLIVMDEADRFVPQNPGNDEALRELARNITDNVKELRKYQIGFMFITQTIAGIEKDIFRNLHYRVYAQGLGVGVDKDHIVDREGQDSFDIYSTLPDPRQSGVYTFMMAGMSALGSEGKPMFVEGWHDESLILYHNAPILKT